MFVRDSPSFIACRLGELDGDGDNQLGLVELDPVCAVCRDDVAPRLPSPARQPWRSVVAGSRRAARRAGGKPAAVAVRFVFVENTSVRLQRR
jgi:hypothetical protein